MTRGVETLLKLADSEDADHREEAARELGQYLPSPRVLKTLANLLGDHDWRVRRASVESFVAADFQKICDPVFNALYDEDNAGKRNAAIDILTRAGKGAIPLMGAHLQAEKKDVRMFLINILGNLRDATYLSAIQAAVRDSDRNLSSAALLALGKIGAPATKQIVLESLETPDSWLKFQAIEAAGEMQDPDAINTLIGFLDIPLYRKVALKALSRFHDPRAYRSVIRAILSNEQDSLEALNALVDLYEDIPPSVLAKHEKQQIRREWQQLVNESALRKLEDKISGLEPDRKQKLSKALTWNQGRGAEKVVDSCYHELNDRTFRLIIDLIYAHSGLRFDETARYMFQRRLSPRISELKLDSFHDYYYHLSHHTDRDAELETIFDLITTNETYFFREERQLQAFSDEIVPAIIREKQEQKTLRIWSAGCASGEEAYTIAMLCHRIPELCGWNIEIFGSDISQRVIQAARRGIYGETSFRNMPESARSSHFEKVENKYRVKDEIRRMVTFGKINLLDREKTGMLNELDLIFCRNVIIYFDTEAKKRVVEMFYQRLRKTGYLLLGHSESLLSLSTKFKLVHLKHDMVYQK